MLTNCEYSLIIILNSRKEVTIMMSFLYSNEYTHSTNAGSNAGFTSCVNMSCKVHSAVMCAVCTFIFALALSIILMDVRCVLISLAIIISIIGLIIIKRDNRITYGTMAPAVS